MKFLFFQACLVSALLLSSCGKNEWRNSTESDEIKQGTNTNIFKVLDRVECTGDSCFKDILWQECKRQGFSEEMPPNKVISSREIRDYVEFTFTQQIEEDLPVTKYTPQGMPYSDGTTSKNITPKTSHVSGFCIGSEYITT